jgi:hypothetical protein
MTKTPLILILFVLLSISTTQAYMINGLLDDWGVVPHIQWIPSASSASFIEEDNWSSAYPGLPSGGELYDVEALYCNIVGNMAYVALVTSFPASGLDSAVPGDFGALPGDFGIDLNRDGIYEYGLKTTGSFAGGLYANPTWIQTSSYPLTSPSHIVGGTLLGIQPLVYQQSAIMENGYPTYIIEGCFDWASMGSSPQSFNLHWTMSCGNDMLDLTVAPVPEPSTLFLLAPGMVTLWAFSRRKKRVRK